MDIVQIIEALRRDAVSFVFVNVLIQQLGLPLPVVPTLLVAGSLAIGPLDLGKILGVAVLATVLADALWFFAGRRFGYRLLSGLCKLSINPASCVSQTEDRFVRWGVASLIVAKFIPGFSAVAPPIAGAVRMPLAGFLVAAATGAGLWAGIALAAGFLLQDSMHLAISRIERDANTAAAVCAAAVALWLAWKLWNKRRFRRLAEIPHILPHALFEALDSDSPPLVLDLRGSTMVAETGVLPGARIASHDRLVETVADWPKSKPIVTICHCPEDAGAIQAARALLDAGYLSVRPLKGGYDGWLDAAPHALKSKLRGL